jgi:threonine dehydrogenase-like Zn-dependent dehydrogenase
VEVGEGVKDLEVGQKVAVYPVLRDGSCHWCEQEVYGLCKKWGFLGYSGYGGGFAEYICIDQSAIHKIPDNMSLEAAALVEPLAVAWHGVKIADLKPDDHALVVGGGTLIHHLRSLESLLTSDYNLGPIGIAVVYCLLAHGVKSVIVSEPSPARAEHAKIAGATHSLDPTKTNVPSFCMDITGGLGVHAVFECAGVQAGFDVALASVRGKGKIVNISVYETPLHIQNPNILNRRLISYIGSNIYTTGEFQEVIDAIASGK